MSRHLFRPAFAFAALLGFTLSAQAADLVVPRKMLADDATLHRFTSPSGVTSAALGLQAPALPAQRSDNRDVVVLVDTSASQVGAHREHAHEVLAELLTRLPKSSRAALFAVDVQAKALTDGFQPLTSDFSSALNTLAARAPLGATKLPAAIRTALKLRDANRSLTVIYIGDGMSAAQMLQSDDVQQLMSELRSAEAPLHAYAVGPKTDLQLLGMLALRSGGVVLEDKPQRVGNKTVRLQADSVAAELAAAVVNPVFYPETLSADGISLLPSEPLPLRSDRQTVYLARGENISPKVVTASGRMNGVPVDLSFAVQTEVGTSDAFLAPLAEQVASADGLTNHLAGANLLKASRDEFTLKIKGLEAGADQAVIAKRFDEARRIAETLQLLDPHNVRAKDVLAQVQPDGDLIDRVIPPAQQRPRAAQPDRVGGVLDRVNQVTQLKQNETARAIQQANQIANDQPDLAIEVIKEQIADLNGTVEMDDNVKQSLLRTLRAEQQDLINLKQRIELEQSQAATRIATMEAERRLIESMTLEEQKITQLTDKVRALIRTGRHGEPDAFERAEEVAEELVDMRPGSAVGAAAFFNSEAAGQLDKFYRLRALRGDRFLETLYQVELSHVPFPDEPPIQWPPAAVWRELTQRRAKWAAVDLHEASPAERKIEEALSQTTEFQFVANPLSEVISFLGDLHNIQIIIDEASLEAEAIDATTIDVTLDLAGISLRSALRIILEPLGLTYVIEDEVMKITTVVAAEDLTLYGQTRVYPVGDLVIPIVPPQVGGLGQGFGGVGGLGQGGGGLGGGQFGAGGAGFGGGQGGGLGGGGFGGGGAFSIPAENFGARRNAPQRRRVGNRAAAPLPAAAGIGDNEVNGLLNDLFGAEATKVESDQSSATGLRFQGFAQVEDNGPFRLDNSSVDRLKKKAVTKS